MSAPEIIPVTSRAQTVEFIKMPRVIYANDPYWVQPLVLERKWHFDPQKNPFYEHAEVQLFLARRDGRNVGRISAHIDRNHNQQYGEQTGFFGWFESIEDPEVSGALLDTAADWLRERQCTLIRGPMDFNVNDQVGCLVAGFDSPPYMMMNHNPPYYAGLYEAAGLKKAMDLYAWRYDAVRDVPPAAMQLAEHSAKDPKLRIRTIDIKRYEQDIKLVLDIYNDAWSTNWGYIPMTEAELKKIAEDFRLILDPELILIAEYDGEPVAVSLAMPNLNEAIKDLGGKLFPFGLLKLLYRLKFARPKSARLIMLGILKELRGVRKYGMLSHALYVEMNRRGQARGYTHGELSWTLEDNHPVNAGIKSMGGKVYKTYRGYEKPLT